MRNNRLGFTLIELMVSVVIIAILVAIGTVTFVYAQKVSRDGRRISDLRSIEAALELYYTKNKAYPGSASVSWSNSYASAGTWIAQSITGKEAFTPGYMRAVPNDPINNSTYAYWYKNSTGADYKVMARMELSNRNAKNNADGGACNGWFEVFTVGYRNERDGPAPTDAVCNTPYTP